MHLALVSDYSFDLLGGAQRALLNEAAALRQAGHRVLLVAPRPRTTPAHDLDAVWTNGPRVPLLDFAVVADDAVLRARLRTRFVRERVEAVHVHSEFAHARAAVAVARELGLRVLHTVHTAYWPALPPGIRAAASAGLDALGLAAPRVSGDPLLDRTVAAALAADVVISPSRHQAADLGRFGLDAVVHPNCWSGAASATPLPGGRALHIAWIGRCVPEKRLGVFVRAVTRAQRRLPPGLLRATVAGAGPTLPVARMLAAGAHIRFAGRLSAAAVHELIAASDLTALTSFGFDNQPMTVVESIRAGRGVLVADPRIRDGLDAGAGLYARTPDARGIADLLVDLAQDRPRVEAAAGAARDAAAAFAPAAFVAFLERLILPDASVPVGGVPVREIAASAPVKRQFP